MIDIGSMAANLDLPTDKVMELITLFLDSTALDLGRAESALVVGDCAALAAAFHEVRGAALNLGLTELSRTAGDAEAAVRSGGAAGAGPEINRLRALTEALAESLRAGTERGR